VYAIISMLWSHVMVQELCILISDEDRIRLEAIVIHGSQLSPARRQSGAQSNAF
jgi:hypothetical protein